MFQVWWKRDGCGPFEKQPIEKKTVRDAGKKRYGVFSIFALNLMVLCSN